MFSLIVANVRRRRGRTALTALGIAVGVASVVALLALSSGLDNTAGQLVHGGALMAFADSVGALATVINLPEGAGGTTTIESKTNFVRGAREGETIVSSTTPVHLGRRTQVWQTRLETEDGKLVAIVTQTQLVL